ncbi:MAG: right-handed parallel beta-helix repeat-containing protein [Armatimonadetes bacterium]|nr:right-handed parallel beta-helix repeat-containing protein [Armatimonadota bacterium]
MLKRWFKRGLILVALLSAAGAGAQSSKTIRVKDVESLTRAVAGAQAGTKILVAPGEYRGGLFFANVRGRKGRPVVIAGENPKKPPVFRGTTEGMHFSEAAYLDLRHLTFIGASGNGLNIDNGGSYETPAHHIVLRGLIVKDVGPEGNHDGIKLSGVDDFLVEGCTLERWGTGGGSGVDMVGCHRGAFHKNVFRHTDSEGSTGIQAKGGCSAILVQDNRFENAGGRAINIGGSTGLEFFRPSLPKPLGARPRFSEAKDILVEHNVFTGSGAPVAFVGVDGAVVRYNTIYRPKRWAVRILQETVNPAFVPSRNGRFTDNIVVFRAGEWAEAVNIGPNTAPQTFRFARNLWHCQGDPSGSRPALPTPEIGGIYGKDPLFRNPDKGDFRLKPGSPAINKGAYAARK